MVIHGIAAIKPIWEPFNPQSSSHILKIGIHDERLANPKRKAARNGLFSERARDIIFSLIFFIFPGYALPYLLQVLNGRPFCYLKLFQGFLFLWRWGYPPYQYIFLERNSHPEENRMKPAHLLDLW